ncbi:hypothetical protein EDC01DRAFT_658616 [Geopyxis carbonaria]|nr:hypothetical protein EDC01DRAFT_658616 [Geopyxis carbonaria]
MQISNILGAVAVAAVSVTAIPTSTTPPVGSTCTAGTFTGKVICCSNSPLSLITCLIGSRTSSIHLVSEANHDENSLQSRR